jgi:hypothetical protein
VQPLDRESLMKVTLFGMVTLVRLPFGDSNTPFLYSPALQTIQLFHARSNGSRSISARFL